MRYLILTSLFFFSHLSAENIIWSGEVSSDGSPTKAVDLKINTKYQLRVSGALNLGKFFQQDTPLADDACYEFISKTDKPTSPLKNFKNSLDIFVCDGKYHSDHIYTSKPFVAKQGKIHFWIDDFDYSDNTGSLQVDIIQLD